MLWTWANCRVQAYLFVNVVSVVFYIEKRKRKRKRKKKKEKGKEKKIKTSS
jgi:hypothetical protein